MTELQKSLARGVHLVIRTSEIHLLPCEEADVEAHLAYIYNSPPDFLKRIGFDLQKLPGKEPHRLRFLESVRTARSKGTFYVVVARMNGKTVAVVNLPMRELPDVPRAHFHIFEPGLRGKGLGLPILKTGLWLLMNAHQVDRIFIEPKSDNVPMNRLLVKAGFRFLGESVYCGPSTVQFQAFRYEVLLSMLPPPEF